MSSTQKTQLEGAGNILRKPCRHGTMLFNGNDIHIGRSLDLYGEWAEQELRILGTLLRKGDLVIDVGANLGTHALFFAQRVGAEGCVHAIEPQRAIFEMLCANLKLNEIDWVEAHCAAAGDKHGTALIPELDPSAMQNFGSARVDLSSKGSNVPMIRLDDLTDLPVRMIKIDAEGMETAVLLGAQRMIREHRPILYVENNDDQKSSSVIETLLGFDYKLYWYFSPFYNPENFFGNSENVFGGIADVSLLCVDQDVPGMIPVLGNGDTARAALDRLNALR